MKKRVLFILISFLVTGITYSQIDQEISSFVDSTELIVNNGRKMILKNLSENNIEKANEVYLYLSKTTSNENYAAFYYIEDLYINLIAKNWFVVSDYMENYHNKVHKTIYPSSNEMITILYKMLMEKSDTLMTQLKNSKIDKESKQAIELFLYILKSEQPDEYYNNLLMGFKNDYPNSKYNNFIKFFLPNKKIHGSMAISFGSGVVFTTENLAQVFESNASFNMSLDINIQKVFTSLYLNTTSLKLKEPFSAVSDQHVLDFRFNESFHYLDAGLKGGYFIIRSNHLHLSPYLSVSGSSLKSNRFEPVDDDMEFEAFNSFTYGGGIHVELKIKDFEYTNIYGSQMNSFISMKIDAGYNVISKIDDKFFEGNTPYISLALLWGIGEF